MVRRLEQIFPALSRGDYQITSPSSRRHNCIAWAAGDSSQWWWPNPVSPWEYWPPGLVHETSIAAFQSLFASLGYEICSSAEWESGFEKIALFAEPDGFPTHAARQLPSGRWTSKIGKMEDIEHALHDLEGTAYGSVVQIMRRPLANVKQA